MIKLNGVEIKPTIFPDGTSQVWQVDEKAFGFESELNEVEWEFENESEIIQVAQLCDLLNNKYMRTILRIPYFPYARQDKDISNNNTFAKSTFIKILKTFPVESIITKDIHSSIYNKNLPNLINESAIYEIQKLEESLKPTLICFPDKGAKDRYERFIIKTPTCSMSKERDQNTGRIAKLFFNELVEIRDESILIIDDICDRGGTFILTANKLLDLGAREVNLYTTHGLYTGGEDIIFDVGINRIFNRKGEVFRDGR
jgi:ribose-phosphate pyrophosphokinase